MDERKQEIRLQAEAGGDIRGPMDGRAGDAKFPIGRAAIQENSGATPYDLLSASLAACTAMTIRAYARRKSYDLTHVDVAVAYHHQQGERDSFDRIVTLSGSLSPKEKESILIISELCPVGKTLSAIADIRTRESNVTAAPPQTPLANYDADLADLPIPYIDAD